MFCENCGAKIADGDLFCQGCGKKISLPTAQGAQPSQPEAAPTISNQPVQPMAAPTISNQPAQPMAAPAANSQPEQPMTAPAASSQPKQPMTAPAASSQPKQPQNHAIPVNKSQTKTATMEKPAEKTSAEQPAAAIPYEQIPAANPYAKYTQNSQQGGQNGQPAAGNPYAQPQQGSYFSPAQNGSQASTAAMKPSKLNKKVLIIAGAALVVVIAAIILICVFVSKANSPEQKMIDAINEGDYAAASTIYYENMSELSGNEAVIETLQGKVDEIKEAYKNGDIDYDTANDKLDDIYSIPLSYMTDINSARSYIYDLHESEEYFNSGEEALNNKEYDTAIYYYDKVIEDDKNYSTAQSQKAKAVDGIRQEYLDNAKKEFDDGNYSYAISYLESGLENEYLKDDETLNNQIGTYVDEIIKKSDEMLANKEYSDAKDLIDSMMYSFDTDSSYYSKLNTQAEKLDKEIPATLHEMDINNSDYFYRYQSGSKDVTGNVYDGDNVCTMSTSKYSADNGAYAEVYAKDYKKVMGTLAVENNSFTSSNNVKAYIEILGDDKSLYKSETLTNKSKPITFEVDTTDVEWLQIKLIYVSGNGYMDVILSDVEFYKIGSSAPDAPKAESSKEESSKAESSKAENSKAESSSSSSKAESSKSESTSKAAENSSKKAS